MQTRVPLCSLAAVPARCAAPSTSLYRSAEGVTAHSISRKICRAPGVVQCASSSSSGNVPSEEDPSSSSPSRDSRAIGALASLERSFALGSAAEPDRSNAPPMDIVNLWPSIDWSRYNLQILFVDRTDTIRARVASGLLERIAEWNGYGRCILPWSAGLYAWDDTVPGDTIGEMLQGGDIATKASVVAAATHLKLPPRSMARPPERFDMDDLDRYDLVLTLDRDLRDQIMSHVPDEYREYYEGKVCLLTTFSAYESEGTLLEGGGLALLPRQLSWLLRPCISSMRQVVDIVSPRLSSVEGEQEWKDMVQVLILSCGGLLKYLIDAYPEDMPHYDPVD